MNLYHWLVKTFVLDFPNYTEVFALTCILPEFLDTLTENINSHLIKVNCHPDKLYYNNTVLLDL